MGATSAPEIVTPDKSVKQPATMSENPQSENLPHYLNGDFSKELNYKLWSTKGARFSAAERLKTKHRLSAFATTLLAAYLIVFNLLEVLVIKDPGSGSADIRTFINISLSIIILIYSQLESSSNYLLRSERHHTCALDIGALYNQLRQLKTTGKDLNIENKVKSISEDYDELLRRFENHERIDFEFFKSQKPTYEAHNLAPSDVRKIQFELYLRTSFLYHLSILGPLFAIGTYLLLRS